MPSKIIPLSVICCFILILACASAPEEDKITPLTLKEYGEEYALFKKRLSTNSQYIRRMSQTGDLSAFLKELETCFFPLNSDYHLSLWFREIGLGSDTDVDISRKYRNGLINMNEDVFFRLAQASGEQYADRIIAAWREYFGWNPGKEAKAELDKIEIRLDELEKYFEKNPITDLKRLTDDAKNYKEVIFLRNQYARLLGFNNYLEYIYSADDIKLLDMIYSIVEEKLVNTTQKQYDIGGIYTMSIPVYFSLLSSALVKMNLKIKSESIQFFVSDKRVRGGTLFIGEGRVIVRLYLPLSGNYPDVIFDATDTLFHEAGHALHLQHLIEENPILRNLDMPLTETVAIFFEGIIANDYWMSNYFRPRLKPAEIALLLMDRKERICSSLKYYAFFWNFEKSLYLDTDQDIYELVVAMKEKYSIEQIRLSSVWDEIGYFNAMKFYYNNYAIGFVLADMLTQYCTSKFGAVYYENPLLGDFLVSSILKYGKSRTYSEVLGIFLDINREKAAAFLDRLLEM